VLELAFELELELDDVDGVDPLDEDAAVVAGAGVDDESVFESVVDSAELVDSAEEPLRESVR